MPGPRRPPLTLKQQRAHAMQLENDTAGLLLVRQAALLEAAGLRAANAGKLDHARAKMEKAASFRTVAARLVLTKRPASLGVPRWLPTREEAGGKHGAPA